MAISSAGEYRSGVGAASCANAPKLVIKPMASKTTEVLFMRYTFSVLDVKSSLRFRRPGARDDLDVTPCGVGDDFRLPVRERLQVHQVRANAQRRSSRFQKAGRRLQRDTAGRHQPQIRKRSLQRFEIAGSAH